MTDTNSSLKEHNSELLTQDITWRMIELAQIKIIKECQDIENGIKVKRATYQCRRFI